MKGKDEERKEEENVSYSPVNQKLSWTNNESSDDCYENI